MEMERTWAEEEELECFCKPHHSPVSFSSFIPSNSSQVNIQNSLFFENALSQLNINVLDTDPLHSPLHQYPSPSDTAQLPPQSLTLYPPCSISSYNDIQQTPPKLDRQSYIQDTLTSQLPTLLHTHEPALAMACDLTLPQLHPYQRFSYEIDPNTFSGCHHQCCLDSPKPALSSLTATTSECCKQVLMKGCFNPKKFCPSSNQHHKEKSIFELRRSKILQSQYLPHDLLPIVTRHNSLEDLRGRMVAAAKNQYGYQFLQKKLEEGRMEDIEMIFLEVKNHVCELMVDPLGNYLVQKLIEVCNEEKRTEIILSTRENEFELICTCLDLHGTCAMQKLLEHLTTTQQISLVISALQPGTIRLSRDVNGYHVMLHCFQLFSSDENKPLSTKIADDCVEVATDRSGCCVLEQCVENAQGEQKERLVNEITSNALLLAQDKYGNCVVQFLLGLNQPRVTTNVLRQLQGRFVHLSMQKFSSNVVERCLKEATQEEVMEIVRELLGSPNPLLLLQDAYANYVIQSALEVAKGPVYDAIVDLVKMHAVVLRSHPYGKKILSSIKLSKLHMYSCACRQR